MKDVGRVMEHFGYAHLSPAYLSAEVGLLDAPSAQTPPPRADGVRAEKRAKKGQRTEKGDHRLAKVVEFPM
jgi:hypothetical protein